MNEPITEQHQYYPSYLLECTQFFKSAQTSEIFYNLFQSKNPMVVPLVSLNSNIDLIRDTQILDIYFIPNSNGSVFEWMNSLTEILEMAPQNDCNISIVNAFIYDTLFDT